MAGGFLATNATWEAAQSPTRGFQIGMRLGLRLPEISSGRTQGQKLKEEEYWGEVRGCRGYKMRLVLTWQGSGRTALGLMEQTAPEAFLPFLLQLLLPNHQVSLHPFNFAFLLFFFSLFFSLTLPCFLEVLLVGTAFNSHGKSSKKCCISFFKAIFLIFCFRRCLNYSLLGLWIEQSERTEHVEVK